MTTPGETLNQEQKVYAPEKLELPNDIEIPQIEKIEPEIKEVKKKKKEVELDDLFNMI